MTATILYTSRYGYTESVAQAVGGRLTAEGHTVEVVEAHRWTPLPDSDVVIVGAPIYGGGISGGLVGCLELNLNALLERKLFFFLSCLNDGDKAERQLADSVPPQLIPHSSGSFYVGGRVQFDVLRWMDRQVMRTVAGIDSNVDTTAPEQIDALVKAVLAP